MQLQSYVAIVGLVGALSMAAPLAHAAPAPQQPGTTLGQMGTPGVTPALEAAMQQGVLEVFPAESFQQIQPQFLPLQTNLYLLSHPALYWPVEQEPAAQALAEELAERSPGWGTTVADGPQGYGVYLTYHHNG